VFAAVVVLSADGTDDSGNVVMVEIPDAHVEKCGRKHKPVSNIVVDSVVAFANAVVLSLNSIGARNVVLYNALSLMTVVLGAAVLEMAVLLFVVDIIAVVVFAVGTQAVSMAAYAHWSFSAS
jgi:prepilin signal peptidase PulO-like enzyme (type II secretory pathway)